MDLITGLPTVQGQDCIYVVVDKLTNFAHFFAIPSRSSSSQVAELFFREVFQLHGFPKTIVSDRDNRFMGPLAKTCSITQRESYLLLLKIEDDYNCGRPLLYIALGASW